jgi:hypothetical protein
MRNQSNGRSRRLLPLAGVALLALLPACDLDTVLEVNDPFTVTPGVARDTANLRFAYGGARAQFGLAYGGEQNEEGGIIMHVGLFGDEMYAWDSFGTRIALDERDIDYDGLGEATTWSYQYLQRARQEALTAAGLFEGSSLEGSAMHAELYNLAGYAVLMLGENFCSGVPLSGIDEEGELVFGEPLTTQQLFERAVELFQQARTVGGDAAQAHLSRVGEARALLDLARFAEAASVAAQVPAGFQFDIEYSGSAERAYNAVFNMSNEEKRFSASAQEGTENLGLPFGSVQDGRILLEALPTGNASRPGFVQLKYESRDADIPLATGYEALYIRAEAALQEGDAAAMVSLVNQARAAQGLDALPAAELNAGMSREQLVDVLFAERAYAMWLTAHRLGDMRRLIRQYGRTEDQVFPTGETPYNTTYGDAVVFDIPQAEQNNPNFTGCLDTSA